MKNFRFSLALQIVSAFLFIIVAFGLYSGWNVLTLRNNAHTIERNTEVGDPSLAALNELELLVVRSKMLVTNWVYLQMNDEDKKALRALHDVEYPALRGRLEALAARWDDAGQQARLDTLLGEFDALLVVEEQVMKALVSFEDYEDPVKKTFEGESRIEDEVLPRTTALLTRLDALSSVKIEEQNLAKGQVLASFQTMRNVVLLLSVTFVPLIILIALLTARNTVRPINRLRATVQRLGRGELPDEAAQLRRRDEIGDMAEAVSNLCAGLRSTLTFAENIGQGNLDAEFTPLSENDVLGHALLEMRCNLKRVAEDETRRNWATEGLARFGEILRQNTNDLSHLADDIIANLVKYTGANQGRLFIVNEDDAQDPYLALEGCYAWDRKKHVQQRIEMGEGLAGQAWQENTTIFLTDVPDGYVEIRSGLGHANPTCVLIVPLKVNEATYGIIELASFRVFVPHEVEFVERIGTSIGSTVSSVRVNQRTTHLLEESQMLTEQMRAQEEEMRQNMEELQATQEEMQRAQREAHNKENLFETAYLMVETDEQGVVRQVNGRATDLLGHTADELRGRLLAEYVADASALGAVMQRLPQGQPWHGAMSLRHRGGQTVPHYVAAGTIDAGQSATTRCLFVFSPSVAAQPATAPATA